MEDRLRKFATLVEAGSFTRAALAMHVSQPALTVAINKLERELSAVLLLRGPRVFTLTPAGELAYRSAKQIGVTTSNLTTGLDELAGSRPIVTIGLIDSMASMLFNQRSNSNKAQTANAFDDLLNISVIVNNSRYLLRATSQDEIDISFITQQPGLVSELLTVDDTGVEPLVLICHPDKKTEVETKLRHHQPAHFISYDRPSTSFNLIQNSLFQHRITVAPIFYSSSPEIMLELVLRGRGMSVLPYFLVQPLLASGKLSTVKYPGLILIDRPISTVIRKGKRLPEALMDLSLFYQNILARQLRQARMLT